MPHVSIGRWSEQGDCSAVLKATKNHFKRRWWVSWTLWPRARTAALHPALETLPGNALPARPANTPPPLEPRQGHCEQESTKEVLRSKAPLRLSPLALLTDVALPNLEALRTSCDTVTIPAATAPAPRRCWGTSSSIPTQYAFFRAREALRSLTWLAREETRHCRAAQAVWKHYQIRGRATRPLVSRHQQKSGKLRTNRALQVSHELVIAPCGAQFQSSNCVIAKLQGPTTLPQDNKCLLRELTCL